MKTRIHYLCLGILALTLTGCPNPDEPSSSTKDKDSKIASSLEGVWDYTIDFNGEITDYSSNTYAFSKHVEGYYEWIASDNFLYCNSLNSPDYEICAYVENGQLHFQHWKDRWTNQDGEWIMTYIMSTIPINNGARSFTSDYGGSVYSAGLMLEKADKSGSFICIPNCTLNAIKR